MLGGAPRCRGRHAGRRVLRRLPDGVRRGGGRCRCAAARWRAGPIRVRMGLHTGEPLADGRGLRRRSTSTGRRGSRPPATAARCCCRQATAALAGDDAARPRPAPAQGPERPRAHLPARDGRVPAAEDAAPDEPARSGDAVPRPRARDRRDRRSCCAARGRPARHADRPRRHAARRGSRCRPPPRPPTTTTDGVWWVPLASLARSRARRCPTTAQALGSQGRRSPSTSATSSLLLLLDNFEHLLDAAAGVARAARGPARTSRARHEPRAAPRRAASRSTGVDPFAEADAVGSLRASAPRAVSSDFVANGEVAEICRAPRLPAARDRAGGRAREGALAGRAARAARAAAAAAHGRLARERPSASGRCARRSTGATTC